MLAKKVKTTFDSNVFSSFFFQTHPKNEVENLKELLEYTQEGVSTKFLDFHRIRFRKFNDKTEIFF